MGSDKNENHEPHGDGVGSSSSGPEQEEIDLAAISSESRRIPSDDKVRVSKLSSSLNIVDALPPPPETTRPGKSTSSNRPAVKRSNDNNLGSTMKDQESSAADHFDLDLDDIRAAQEEELMNFALERSLTDLGESFDRGLDLGASCRTVENQDRERHVAQRAQTASDQTEVFVETARNNRSCSSGWRNARITPLRRPGRGTNRSTSTSDAERFLGSSDSRIGSVDRRLSADSWMVGSDLSPTSANNMYTRPLFPTPVSKDAATMPHRGGRAAVLEAAKQHLSPAEVELIEQALRADAPPCGDNADRSLEGARRLVHTEERASMGGSNHSSPGFYEKRRMLPSTAAKTRSNVTKVSEYNLDGAEEHLSEEELAQIRQALGESEKTARSGPRSTMEEPSTLRANEQNASFSGILQVDAGSLSSQFDFDNAKDHLSEQELLEIKQALQDAEGGNSSEGIATGLAPAESEAIQKALRDAEEVLEWKSFELAVRMAQDEAIPVPSPSPARRHQGNVRTMTRAEYLAEQFAQASHVSRSEPYSDDMGDNYVAAGFRLNSSTKQEWSRRNHDSVIGPNHEIRSKHDPWLQSVSNAERLGLDTDEGRVPTVGTRAYNTFMESMKRNNKGVAANGTGRAGSDSDGTKGGAMDANVRLQISKAINSGLIDHCNGVVKEGKEALVYHADRAKGTEGFDVAVKVFKHTQEFRGRGEYVDGDPRYNSLPFRKAGERDQLEIWAEKEYRNLLRANRAGVPVPTPLFHKENIVFMRFMGIEGWPAPQMRELSLQRGSQRWVDLYRQVLNAVVCLYQNARLVHGDLSEYNIMVVPGFLVDNSEDRGNNDLQAVLIDFGQAVDVRHPDAQSLLRRDLSVMSVFFSRMGVQTETVDNLMALVVGHGDG